MVDSALGDLLGVDLTDPLILNGGVGRRSGKEGHGGEGDQNDQREGQNQGDSLFGTSPWSQGVHRIIHGSGVVFCRILIADLIRGAIAKLSNATFHPMGSPARAVFTAGRFPLETIRP